MVYICFFLYFSSDNATVLRTVVKGPGTVSMDSQKEDRCSAKTKIHLVVDFEKETKFKGRSVEDGLPVTKPLYDLEELLAWIPNDASDAGQVYSVASVPYFGKHIPKGSYKTLVCHDMEGGYLDDRYGVANIKQIGCCCVVFPFILNAVLQV